MLSDAALAVAVDSNIKWIYNASRRLRRPIRRTLDDAAWWRLTHHLSGRLGLPLTDAARASDLVLGEGAELARVRLRSTSDDAVSVSVDVSRFQDGTALAVAAALRTALPRRRGRPPKSRLRMPTLGKVSPVALSEDPAVRLSRAFSSPRLADGTALAAIELLEVLADEGVPFVITGAIAQAFLGVSAAASSVDLVADLAPRNARMIAAALNRFRAVPRGVPVRDGFALDAALVRSVPCLALLIGGVEVNVDRALPGVGEFPQVRESSTLVAMERQSFRVLSAEGYDRSSSTLARLTGVA